MITQFRTKRLGPEYKLIESFVDAMELVFSREHSQEQIFLYEPRVGDAFPDLLILSWDKETKVPNLEARKKLEAIDVKIAHHLSNSKVPKNETELRHVLGFSNTALKRSLDRLANAELLTSSDLGFQLNVNAAFILRKIIAVEAKIDGISAVVQQAMLNIAFSSESYVLMPRDPAGRLSDQVAQFKQFGIIAMDEASPRLLRTASSQPLPVSVFSWFLNEHIVRDFID